MLDRSLPAARALPAVTVAPNGRTVFVAKPAFDMYKQYSQMVDELRGRGFAVVPDPNADLPDENDAALAVIREALSRSELSVHQLGLQQGPVPLGATQGLVALQLAEAAAWAKREPSFHRWIWVPRVLVLIDQQNDTETVMERDPFEGLAQFGAAIERDQIDSDTLTRFGENVRHRLQASAPAQTAAPASVYVAAAPQDLAAAKDVAKRLKDGGAKATLASGNDFALATKFDRLICCWGNADEATMFDLLDRVASPGWRAARPKGRLVLLTLPPDSESKRDACELDSFGAADLVLPADLPAGELVASIMRGG